MKHLNLFYPDTVFNPFKLTAQESEIFKTPHNPEDYDEICQKYAKIAQIPDYKLPATVRSSLVKCNTSMLENDPQMAITVMCNTLSNIAENLFNFNETNLPSGKNTGYKVHTTETCLETDSIDEVLSLDPTSVTRFDGQGSRISPELVTFITSALQAGLSFLNLAQSFMDDTDKKAELKTTVFEAPAPAPATLVTSNYFNINTFQSVYKVKDLLVVDSEYAYELFMNLPPALENFFIYTKAPIDTVEESPISAPVSLKTFSLVMLTSQESAEDELNSILQSSNFLPDVKVFLNNRRFNRQ